MYLLVITAASQSIDLASAYFVPDRLTTEALVAALAEDGSAERLARNGGADDDMDRARQLM